MEGRFNDGRTAASRPASATIEGDTLVIAFNGDERRWPLGEVDEEQLGERTRLSWSGHPERLTLEAAAWREATRARALPLHRRRSGRTRTLVLSLAAAAASVAALVFVGIPALSGVLAQRTPLSFERQMGESFDAQVGLALPACTGKEGQAALASFGRRIGQAGDSAFDIRVRAVHAPMVNAFALPGGSILVTDELIDMAETPDELSAVIAHEVAHVEKRHVMQAVWRSLGFGLLLDAVVGGGSGAGQQAVLLAGSATNLRYSREAEAEADARGQELLHVQGLSSQGMAAFFQRLSAKGEGARSAAVKELLSDHPDSARRVRLSHARGRPGATAFTAEEWSAIRSACADRPKRMQPLRKLF